MEVLGEYTLLVLYNMRLALEVLCNILNKLSLLGSFLRQRIHEKPGINLGDHRSALEAGIVVTYTINRRVSSFAKSSILSVI